MAEATMAETRLWVILQGMIMERQRLLIGEANYLRGLMGLPPVRATANAAPVPPKSREMS
jgi:hypothetical protein